MPFVGSSRTANRTLDATFGYIFGFNTSSNNSAISQYYDKDVFMYYYIPSSLQTVTITNTDLIPYGAFYNCENITNIIIPDGVTKIGENAFYNTGYYNNSSNWKSNGLYLNNDKVLIEARISGDDTYVIQPTVISITDGAFDDIPISRMDPTLKRSYGAVWYNN